MKSPKAGRGGEALMTAAENFLPFVGAAKSALEGDYRNAMIQAGLDVALPPAVKGAAALSGKFLAPVLAGAIKAYHGSPYKFDKFDMSKIGTGEGAQAYGHGLYFAENPKVAADYKKNVTASKQYDFWTDEIRSKLPKALTLKEFDELGALSRKMDSGLSAKEMSRWRELKDINTNYDNAVKELTPTGNLYEVDLRWPDAAREAADPLSPQHFFDYDKPLGEQAPFVLSALERGGYKLSPTEREIEKHADEMLKMDAMDWADETGGDWVDFSNNANWDSYVDAAREQLGGMSRTKTGEQFYKELVKESGYNPILFEDSAEYAESAAGHLRSLDIPGIRYKDAASRGTEGGTSNYVIFSDELAEILKRNEEQMKRGGAVIMKEGGGKVKPDYKSAMEMMFHAMNNPSLKRA
jgi:hypothetical protein